MAENVQIDVAAGKLVEALNRQRIATLAAAMIGAAGRPVSVNEAMALMTDLQNSLERQDPSSPRFQAWKKDFDGDKPFA